MHLVLLSLAACLGSATHTSTPLDSGTLPTGDTAANAPTRPIEWRGWGMYTRLGHALSFVDAEGPLLAMSSPGCCGYDDQSRDRVSLIDPLVQNDGAGTQGAVAIKQEWIPQGRGDETFFGSEVLTPGDVTGDSLDDLVVFDTSDFLGHGAWLFHGSLLDPRSSDESLSPISGVPWRGTPCGDISGDGAPDLCTAAGVALGPIGGPITAWHTTWTATAPTADVHLAASSAVADGLPGLLLSDPTASAVHRLTTFPAGDVDLATEASATWTAPAPPTRLAVGGDLDGDGAGDLVVAWSGAVAVSTTLGGDLDSAHATYTGDAQALAIADFDGDGSDDLAIGGVGEVLLFLGPLPAGDLLRTDAANVLTGHEFPDDEFGFALAARDLDDDGDAELAVAAPGASYLPGYRFPGGRVFLFHDPANFSWDAFDPPVEPIWPASATEE